MKICYYSKSSLNASSTFTFIGIVCCRTLTVMSGVILDHPAVKSFTPCLALALVD